MVSRNKIYRTLSAPASESWSIDKYLYPSLMVLPNSDKLLKLGNIGQSFLLRRLHAISMCGNTTVNLSGMQNWKRRQIHIQTRIILRKMIYVDGGAVFTAKRKFNFRYISLVVLPTATSAVWDWWYWLVCWPAEGSKADQPRDCG